MSTDTKFCVDCGTRLPRDAKFCLNCGNSQDNDTPQTKSIQPSRKTAAVDPNKILMTAKGTTGRLDLFENKVRIHRNAGCSTLFLQGLKGDKDIFIHQISSIQFKNSGLTAGYIQFSFLGGLEAKRGVWEATQDENTIMFKGGNQQREFEVIRDAIESKMDLHRRRT